MCDQYAELIVPLRLDAYFTYKVPVKLQSVLTVGARVWVFLGHRLVVGWLWKYPAPPPVQVAREILAVIDEKPLLTAPVRHIYEWISTYYMLSLGSLLRTVIPSSLRQPRSPYIELGAAKNVLPEEISAAFLEKKKRILRNFLQIPSCSSATLEFLLSTGALELSIAPSRKVAPPLPAVIKLCETLPLSDIKLANAPKQQAVFEQYLQLRGQNDHCRSDLLVKDARTAAILRKLLEKKYLIAVSDTKKSPLPLTSNQKAPFTTHSKGKVILCNKVTDEALTKWMLWVADQLKKGQSVLWLLPTEAALRLRRRQLLPYLDQVDTFHGQLSAGKRGQLFSSVGCGETRLILGIRKCVFLPYPKLDVIFVEEDHQDQFKEQKSAFRYHARDVAIMCGHMHGAQVVLLTDSPALESLDKVWKGHYLRQPMRAALKLPPIALAAFEKEAHQLPSVLVQALEKGHKSLIFHPNKGYGSYIQCRSCGEVPFCSTCSIPYSATQQGIYCRLCDTQMHSETSCKKCAQAHNWRIKGTGTDHLYEHLELSYPQLKIGRWEGTDAQTAPNQVLQKQFESSKIDVLLATEHMLYGWKVPPQTLLLLWSAEKWLYKPHYRADEHFMQWIYALQAQLMGQDTRIYLHTQHQKGQILLKSLLSGGSYEAFAAQEALKRKDLSYPPYVRLLSMSAYHAQLDKLQEAISAFSAWLQSAHPHIQAQTGPPLWQSKQHRYIQRLLLRLPKRSQSADKHAFGEWVKCQSSSVNWHFEVDY